MAITRHVRILKVEGKWSWKAAGHLWEYRMEKRKGLWREGCPLGAWLEIVPILCPDDAVIFSLGFEAGIAGMPRKAVEEEAG